MLSSALSLSRRFVGRANKPMVNLFSTVPNVAEGASKAASLSVVKHPFDLNKSPLLDNSTVEDVDQSKLFAIVRFNGKQYKLAKDDVIVADNIHNVDIGDSISVDDVLLVGSKHGTLVGRPYVAGAQVQLSVEELTKDKKVTILKFRRRKNSRRQRGFRRQLTILRVDDIVPPADLKKDLDV